MSLEPADGHGDAARASSPTRRRWSSKARATCRRCANGDWFVGWGQEPYFSELSAERAAAVRRALPAARRSPTAASASPGPAPPRIRRRSLRARRRRRGDRLRELERRHAGGVLAAARGRDSRAALQHRSRTVAAQRLRDGDRAARRARSGLTWTVQALDAAGSVLGTSAARRRRRSAVARGAAYTLRCGPDRREDSRLARALAAYRRASAWIHGPLVWRTMRPCRRSATPRSVA